MRYKVQYLEPSGEWFDLLVEKGFSRETAFWRVGIYSMMGIPARMVEIKTLIYNLQELN